MSPRPVIGVTGPAQGGGAAWLMASVAVARAGGVPRRITPTSHTDRDELKRRLAGLIIGGGADVHPELYYERAVHLGEIIRATVEEARRPAEKPSSHFWRPAILVLRYLLESRQPTWGFDRARDRLEREMLEFAVDHDLPILGICRGAQLFNVFFGGTLYPDVRELYVETPLRTVFPRRRIRVEPNSHLCSVVGETTFRVNALHHQAVRTVGRGLRIVARDESGVAQAIEQPGHAFRIGVQWHPEYIPQHERQLALFRTLVGVARTARAERGRRVWL